MDVQNTKRKKFIHGKTWVGLLFLLVGGALFLKQSGYPFPQWLFTWEALLITIGVFTGIRHGFRDMSWFIMILIGSVFLTDRINPGLHLKQYLVPGVIVLLGLLFIVAPKGKGTCQGRGMHERRRRRSHQYADDIVSDGADGALPSAETVSSVSRKENTLDIVCFFSNIKKRVLSKSFMGADIVCIFGGSEINLTNADFNSPVVLEFTQIFGGTKLIVPANWEVRSEVTALFGGIEDKRPQSENTIPEKTIILNGNVIFGGVEINSY